MTYDVIIVGSGASAVTAAYPLVEAGLTVAILDYGNKDEIYKTLVPDTSFMDIRRSDPDRLKNYFPLCYLGAGRACEWMGRR